MSQRRCSLPPPLPAFPLSKPPFPQIRASKPASPRVRHRGLETPAAAAARGGEQSAARLDAVLRIAVDGTRRLAANKTAQVCALRFRAEPVSESGQSP